MGGGYGFFTPANYWYGQSVGVEIIEHSRSEVVESPYQEILSPPGKIRFMNWSILWSYFYQKPDELNRIADGLAAYYLEKNPSTGSFSLRFYYRSESGKNFLKKPVYVKEYN